ncbi:MAG: diacylglycerol kinase [Halocynthiibacter sp.]
MKKRMIAEGRRFWNTCVWSWEGWMASWRSEATLRQWTIINLISVGFTFAVDMTSVEQILLIALGGLILVAELLNTAIEEAVNRISTETHPLSKKAKDAGSAAVGVMAIIAGLAWLVVLFK